MRSFQRETGAVLWLNHHETKQPKDQVKDGRDRPQRASGGGLFSIIDCPVHTERLDGDRVLLAPVSYKFGAAPPPFTIYLEADRPTRPSSIRVVGELTTADHATGLALHEAIVGLLMKQPNQSGNAIARGVHRSKKDVLDALEALLEAGRVDRQQRGQARLWFVSGKEDAVRR